MSRNEVLELEAAAEEMSRMLDDVLAGRPGSPAARQLWPILYLQGFALEGRGRVRFERWLSIAEAFPVGE